MSRFLGIIIFLQITTIFDQYVCYMCERNSEVYKDILECQQKCTQVCFNCMQQCDESFCPSYKFFCYGEFRCRCLGFVNQGKQCFQDLCTIFCKTTFSEQIIPGYTSIYGICETSAKCRCWKKYIRRYTEHVLN